METDTVCVTVCVYVPKEEAKAALDAAVRGVYGSGVRYLSIASKTEPITKSGQAWRDSLEKGLPSPAKA